jgi:hypothetical protein
MAVNTKPRFTKRPDIQFIAGAFLAANTAKDGTGTVGVAFSNSTPEPALLHRIVARPLGTNTNTVLRIFWNNGGSNAVATNNSLIAEMTLPGTTLSEVVAQPTYEMALNVDLPAGGRLLCTLSTAVAAGFAVTVFAGKFEDV